MTENFNLILSEVELEAGNFEKLKATLLRKESKEMPQYVLPSYIVDLYGSVLTKKQVPKRVAKLLRTYVLMLANPNMLPAKAPGVQDRPGQVLSLDVPGYNDTSMYEAFRSVGAWIDVEELIWTGKFVASFLLNSDRLITSFRNGNDKTRSTMLAYLNYWLAIAAAAN